MYKRQKHYKATKQDQNHIGKIEFKLANVCEMCIRDRYAPIPVGEDDRLDIFGKVLGKCNPADIAKSYK